MRIDKFICDTINITRSKARQKISKGCVSVDGRVVKSASEHVDEKSCIVALDGQVINYNKYVYIMMNKPKGVISASTDKHCKTALDLLDENCRRSDLFVAGRLDKDTTGFLFITNDGNFAHDILSPKKHVLKTYEVTLKNCIESDYQNSFKHGIVIDGGYVCKPAQLEKIGDRVCRLKISEGKFHQIKRMFSALNNEVVDLKRIGMGDLFLDENLEHGQYRNLSDKEVGKLLCKLHKIDG